MNDDLWSDPNGDEVFLTREETHFELPDGFVWADADPSAPPVLDRTVYLHACEVCEAIKYRHLSEFEGFTVPLAEVLTP